MRRTSSKATTSTDDLMMTNYEIALNEFMPAFKAKVAKAMVDKHNIGQQRAAELLEMTQASISKYVNEHYSQLVKEVGNGIDDNMINEFVERIMAGADTGAQRIMCKACQKYHKFECTIMVK